MLKCVLLLPSDCVYVRYCNEIISFINKILQSRGRIVHCVVAKRLGGEPSRWRNVQGAKRPGGETSWGRNVQGANWRRGETSSYHSTYTDERGPRPFLEEPETLALILSSLANSWSSMPFALPACRHCRLSHRQGVCFRSDWWIWPLCWRKKLTLHFITDELYKKYVNI